MGLRGLQLAACLCGLAASPAGGGEILILQQAPKDPAREAAAEAREHQRPAETRAANGPVILRAAPLRESERQQLKAQSWIVPGGPAQRRDCVIVVGSQVGTIGEGSGASRSGNVVESGTTSVNAEVQCR